MDLFTVQLVTGNTARTTIAEIFIDYWRLNATLIRLIWSTVLAARWRQYRIILPVLQHILGAAYDFEFYKNPHAIEQLKSGFKDV